MDGKWIYKRYSQDEYPEHQVGAGWDLKVLSKHLSIYTETRPYRNEYQEKRESVQPCEECLISGPYTME